ncbi:MAG: DUF3883 domain-containing protein [Candidatus Paceibacterota bacterium]
MLKELEQYENLGTPAFFAELFNQLHGAELPWTSSHVRGYFYNRIVDDNSVFDGCLTLVEAIGAVTIDSGGNITLNPSLVPMLVNERYLANKLLEMLLAVVKEDEIFHEIFCPKNLSYDIIYKLIQIDGSAFRFRYASFRQLLVSFEFLYPHPEKSIRKYIVNSRYKKLFDQQILPEIRQRKLGIEELEALLERKQIYGEQAESYALEYERKRLAKHSSLGNVELISGYDVAAGYDLISYEDESSTELDRFIEVKSFSGTPSFHWSRNEIDVSRLKGKRYFLYLINRDEMANSTYVPTIIQNPYDEVLSDDSWTKRVDSYFIIKN